MATFAHHGKYLTCGCRGLVAEVILVGRDVEDLVRVILAVDVDVGDAASRAFSMIGSRPVGATGLTRMMSYPSLMLFSICDSVAGSQFETKDA